ncbi:MAG: P-II family nitrogen regulator [Acidimicrobiia bacterium]|nr:P-II family nitrogen regulator [Acidimicrobiia bacterium]
MKLVTAIVKPHVLDDVKEALHADGIAGLTVTEVKGFGRQRGQTEVYRGAEYTIDFVPKLKLEVLVAPGYEAKVAEIVASAARTGKIGDGKIWVTSLDEVMRIRTGETGVDAI